MIDMHLEALLTPRVDSLVAKLGVVDDAIHTITYVPGAFADLVEDFDLDAFEGDLDIAELKQGYGNVWYSVDQYLEDLHFEDTHMSSRLPVWAQAVQRLLLRRLFHGHAFGWASEIFWSVEPSASLGIHVDNDDVYTVQLAGSKTWLIDPVRLEWLRSQVESGKLRREGPWEAWVPTDGAQLSLLEPARIVTQPGDFLAMPAFALHLVTAGERARCLSFNASICQEQNWVQYLEKW